MTGAVGYTQAVLIETLWNVKRCIYISGSLFFDRINRNIVECKVFWLRICSCGYIVLIETLWNVKVGIWYGAKWAKEVLIETLWNVKERIGFCIMLVQTVLIETLWNVKLLDPVSGLHTTSINRNIVECKEQQGHQETAWWQGINRNIVECKDCCRRSSLVRTVVLIETLWNVKVDAKPLWYLGESRINRNIVECKDRHIHSLHRWSCGY